MMQKVTTIPFKDCNPSKKYTRIVDIKAKPRIDGCPITAF